MNKAKADKKLERDEKYRLEAKSVYKYNHNNKLFITGLSIYWGEGEKVNKNRVSIINTDVEMIQVMISFYRKTLKIPESKLRAALFIYEDIDKEKALDFWSKNIKLPINQFIKTQILPSRSTHTKRRSIYGMCTIYFSSVEINIKMKEWLKLLAAEMRV